MKGKFIQNGDKSEHSQYQGWQRSAIRKSEFSRFRKLMMF